MHTDVAAATAAAVVLATASDNMSTVENNNGTNNDWRLWCRLCAKEDPQGNISVFFKDEQQSGGNRETAVCAIAGSSDMSLAAAIGKYFWVEIKRDEDMPKMLCTECFSLVTSLVNFSERVAKVQQMFCVLHNSALVKVPALDLHAMRLKYGLLDEEREHVIMQHQLPEVHYFESKPKINDLEECIFGNETLMATSSNPLEQQQQQQQHQPRIKIKIKKEDILEHLTDEDPDPDDEEDEDFDHENILNEEYDNDEENEDSNCKVVEEVEVEEEQKSLKLRARTIQRLQKPIEVKETTMEPPKKRRRRRRKRKLSLRNENKALNDVDENDDDVVDENESFEENKHEESVADKLQLHLDETNYSCTDCPRKFKRTHHLRQHMKRAHAKATQLGELPCTQCTKVFSTTRQLETHAKVHLPPELRKVIPCPYCETKFSSHTVMQTHIKYIHMNERPFICEECGVGVRTNAALKAHMLTHTDYAPFECEVCKKGFKNQIRLKNHMETHDPNKHVCAKCGLQLNSRATLNRHLLVHSDEMQHKCDYCGRAFKRAKALKNHLILHTGLKPYSCDFCDRTFANGSNCRSHKKKSHPEELAALEAAGGGKTYTRNIPKLEALKAVTKAADNLAPVVSKQSGRFAFGKKPKLIAQEETLDKVTKPELLGNHNKSGTSPSSCSNTTLVLSNAAISTPTNLIALHSAALPTTVPAAGNQVTTMTSSIPNIDNIYSHIMKQASIAAHSAVNDVELAIHIKRPISQASSCVTIDNDGGTSDMPAMQHQQQQHQHQMQSTTPAALAAMPTHLYTQIIKQNMLQQEQQQQLQEQQLHHHHHQHHQQQQQQQHQHLAHQQQMHVDDVASSIRSPESQTSSHMADDHSNTAASVQFYNHIRQNLQGPYI